MKKIYIQPTIEIEAFDVEQMMVASIDGFNKGLNEEGLDGGNALSRRGISVWDDEEDEY